MIMYGRSSSTIASAASRSACPVAAVIATFRAEALDGGVALDEGAVDAEVLVTGEAGADGPVPHRREERRRGAAAIQPRPVVREGGGVEDPLRRVHPAEPAEEQVGVDALDKLALAPHGVEALQQQCLQEHLGGMHGRPISL
jgi:hypothetical protein